MMIAWLATSAVAARSLAAPEPAIGAPPSGAAATSVPGPSGAPAPAGAVEAPAAPEAEGSYVVKLRQLEERVTALKEKVFQSKARLLQLQEVVLHGSVSGARAVLVHRNEMGSSFELAHVQYALDGAPIFNRTETGGGALSKQDEIEIFNGPLSPGSHQLSIYLEYNGSGFGIFSYVESYKFRLKSSYVFNADEGKVTTVRIVGYEKGGFTTELKDRPAVRYDVEAVSAPSGGGPVKADALGGAPSPSPAPEPPAEPAPAPVPSPPSSSTSSPATPGAGAT
jgi:hypothetical protein